MDQLALFTAPIYCSAADCIRPVIARRMCVRHYNRWRRTEGAAECSIDECRRPSASRGWCNAHYLRWKNHGDPLAGKPSPRVTRAIDHADGTRTCCVCANRKTIHDFPADRNATLGRKAKCKVCHSEQVKRWYHQNQERQRERQRGRRVADVARHREMDRRRYEREKPQRIAYAIDATHRRRALMQQVEWERGITVKSLRKRHGDHCCYCAQAMTFTPGNGRAYVPTKATIEHIVALSRGGGHTWANTTLACWQCNVRKNAKPLAEWLVNAQVSEA